MKKWILWAAVAGCLLSCKEEPVPCVVSYCSQVATPPAAVFVPKGTILTANELPVLSAPHYQFKGWEAEGRLVQPGRYTVTGDLRLTARWVFVPETESPSPAPGSGETPPPALPKKVAVQTVNGVDFDIVEFGTFPQTLKEESVTLSAALEPLCGFPRKAGDDGAYYTECVAHPYLIGENPNPLFGAAGVGEPIADGESYAFKWEPLRWRVLDSHYVDAGGSECGRLLLSEKALLPMSYGAESNAYAESEVARFLNDVFLPAAFTEEERSLIQTVLLDQSEASSFGRGEGGDPGAPLTNPYAAGDVSASVFLLSEAEVTREAYGFDLFGVKGKNSSRIRPTTDYARAKGAFFKTQTDYWGAGWWWLRSPGASDAAFARVVLDNGSAARSYHVSQRSEGGLVPAIVVAAP